MIFIWLLSKKMQMVQAPIASSDGRREWSVEELYK